MQLARVVGLVLAVSFTVPGWAASGVTSIEVTPDHVAAKIELPGNFRADLDLQFEHSVGLTAESIGLTATLVDPKDLALSGRLPTAATLISAFPVLIRIEPPGSGPLSFSGVVSIDLHTHNLTYVPGTPLRFYVASAGKPFQDITASMGMGSYRTGANKGGFSEFLIVADLRPVNSVINEKFTRLQGVIDGFSRSIPDSVMSTLQALVDAAQAANDANDATTASEQIQQFADVVKQNSGAIPDVWRSSRDINNVGGELRSAASTLKFSLLLKASGGS